MLATPPPTLAIPLAVPDNGKITLTWDSDSSGKKVTSYTLYMASQSGVTSTNVLNLPDGMTHTFVTSPYTHTGLTNGKTYYFVLTATDANGEGLLSSKVSATPGNGLSAVVYIKASNTGMDDNFGLSVSLSRDGNTLAVGAPGEASNTTGINGDQTINRTFGAGAVYIFTKGGGTWQQQAYIKASNTKASHTKDFDLFGYSVSLSGDGNILAVGAFQEDSNATGINGDQVNNSASNAGTVYLFIRSGSTWQQQAYIKASNTEAYDEFGWSISLSGDGNTLAVGAIGEDSNATGINGDQTNNKAFGAGAVYIFTKRGLAWQQQAYIKASNTKTSNTDSLDVFGYAVSLSENGNTLAVGAIGEDSNGKGINGDQINNKTTATGAVYLFTRSGAVWQQQTYIKASNAGAYDGFGSEISLSGNGNTLAVGAIGEDSNATGINGDQATNHNAIDAGAVYLFTRSGAVWQQQAYIKASNTEAHDGFGKSISLSEDGNTLAVGAYNECSNTTGINRDQMNNNFTNAGAVYLFTRSKSTWQQKKYIKASNTGVGDEFGYSVSLSEDGNILAVGAFQEDSNATGINGDQTNNNASFAGAVYLY